MCSMSAPLAALVSAPGLPAPLWTPARWWRRPRQQLEQQLLSPRRTCFHPWPWSPLLPPHLPAWSGGSALPQGAGRWAQGLGRGSRSRFVRLPPRTARLPPQSRGLGRRSPQPISNGLDAVGEMLGRRGFQPPLCAPVSGERRS